MTSTAASSFALTIRFIWKKHFSISKEKGSLQPDLLRLVILRLLQLRLIIELPLIFFVSSVFVFAPIIGFILAIITDDDLNDDYHDDDLTDNENNKDIHSVQMLEILKEIKKIKVALGVIVLILILYIFS